jgi:hypothetical protein
VGEDENPKVLRYTLIWQEVPKLTPQKLVETLGYSVVKPSKAA